MMRRQDLISKCGCAGGLLLMLALTGCSNLLLERELPEDEPDRVISRIDDLYSRPSWLRESEPFVIDGDRVVSLGGTEIGTDQRIDAAYRIAANNAQAAIAGAIEKRLEFIFQNAEEGTGFDSTQARFIGAEATRLLTSAIRPAHHYWEKIAYTTDYGRRLTKYRVFASMEMPVEEFKRAILAAVHRASGKGQLSPDFEEKVSRQWDRIAESIPTPEPAHVPASVAPVIEGEH